MDTFPSQFRVFDSQGNFVTEFGQPGPGGPTDLPIDPSTYYVTPITVDSFDLWSMYHDRRIQRWSVTGDLLSVKYILEGLVGSGVVYHWDGFNFSLGLFQRGSPRIGPPSLLARSDPVAASVDTLYNRDLTSVPIACHYIASEMGWRRLGVDPLVTDDQRMYVNVPNEDWVHVIDLDSGKESFRFRWDHVADSVPDTLISYYQGDFAFGEDMAAGARWLHKNLSVFDLAAAPNGEIWVERSPTMFLYGKSIMDVFAHDGAYRGRLQVPCPSGTLQPFRGFLYGMGRNGEAPALIRYRLVPTGDLQE